MVRYAWVRIATSSQRSSAKQGAEEKNMLHVRRGNKGPVADHSDDDDPLHPGLAQRRDRIVNR